MATTVSRRNEEERRREWRDEYRDEIHVVIRVRVGRDEDGVRFDELFNEIDHLVDQAGGHLARARCAGVADEERTVRFDVFLKAEPTALIDSCSQICSALGWADQPTFETITPDEP